MALFLVRPSISRCATYIGALCGCRRVHQSWSGCIRRPQSRERAPLIARILTVDGGVETRMAVRCPALRSERRCCTVGSSTARYYLQTLHFRSRSITSIISCDLCGVRLHRARILSCSMSCGQFHPWPLHSGAMCGDMRSYLKRRITSRTLFWQYDSENSHCSLTVLVRHQHTHPRLALLDRAGRPPKAEARDMRPRAVLCEVVGPRLVDVCGLSNCFSS